MRELRVPCVLELHTIQDQEAASNRHRALHAGAPEVQPVLPSLQVLIKKEGFWVLAGALLEADLAILLAAEPAVTDATARALSHLGHSEDYLFRFFLHRRIRPFESL